MTAQKSEKETDLQRMTQLSSSIALLIIIKTGFRIGNRARDKTRPYKIILDIKKERRNLLIVVKKNHNQCPTTPQTCNNNF